MGTKDEILWHTIEIKSEPVVINHESIDARVKRYHSKQDPELEALNMTSGILETLNVLEAYYSRNPGVYIPNAIASIRDTANRLNIDRRARRRTPDEVAEQTTRINAEVEREFGMVSFDDFEPIGRTDRNGNETGYTTGSITTSTAGTNGYTWGGNIDPAISNNNAEILAGRVRGGVRPDHII